MFLMKMGDKFKTFIICLLRMGIVGGGTLALAIYNVDNYLSPSYGLKNIYIVVFACSFFPILATLTTEFYFFSHRKYKKKRKNETVYLNDTLNKKPLTRYKG